MQAENDPRENAPEDAPETPVATGSRWHRLKQFFVTRYVRVIDATSGLLKRLRNRVKASPDAEDGQEDERDEARASRKKPAPPHAAETVEVQPAPRSHVRSFFIYLLVFIIGSIAGMTFSSALVSKMLINQAQKIEDQREEIGQLEKQYSRVLESEAKYRKKLSEVEAQAEQAARNAAKEPVVPPSVNPATPAPGKQLVNKKTGNCPLESGNPAELAKCIEDYNRRGGR